MDLRRDALFLSLLAAMLLVCSCVVKISSEGENQSKFNVSTFTLANGNASVTDRTVAFAINGTDALPGYFTYQMRLSEDGVYADNQWQSYSSSGSFDLTETSGSKTVYLWIKDNTGKVSERLSATVHLQLPFLLGSLKIKLEQGSLSLTNRLHIVGTGIDNLISVKVNNYFCSIVSKTSTEAICEIQASLNPAYYDVILKDSRLNSYTIDKAYAAGAIIFGKTSFLDPVPYASIYNRFSAYHLHITPANKLYLSNYYGSGTSLARFDTLPTSTVPADFLFGRPSDIRLPVDIYYNYDNDLTTKHSISGRNPMCTYGSKFVVADFTNNRILIYPSAPTTWNAEPEFVLGQSNFFNISANAGSTVAANTVSGPLSLWCDSSRIIVADSANHRVLIWNTPIAQNFQSANVVLGQANFTSNSGNRGTTSTPAANSLYSPSGVYSDGTKLFIADSSNARILIFNSIPTVSSASADKVLGQTSFTVRTSGITQGKLNTPRNMASNSSYLYVTDVSNNRVLAWSLATDISTWANGKNADLVLGQANFTSNAANRGTTPSASSFWNPYDVVATNGQVFVSDLDNNRVLGWNSLPTSNGQAADFVLGQSSMTRNDITPNPLSSTLTIGQSRGIFKAPNGNYWYFDYEGRITRYPGSSVEANNAEADLILGQSDFTASGRTGVPTASSLNHIFGGYVDPIDGYVMVADTGNARILIWTSEITTNNQPADIVLGQAEFTTKTGATTANGLSNPYYMCRTGNYLFVSDAGNNRILRYTYPLSTGMAADLVLGQSSFTLGTANAGGVPNASSLFTPYGLYCSNNKLIVAERGNHRVLIWNTLPTTNNQPADVVVGQPNFTSNTANNGGISASSLNTPRGVTSDGVKLIVGDNGNRRILIWNTIPTSNGTPADKVIGQNGSFTTNYKNCNLPVTESDIQCPTDCNHVHYLGNNLISTGGQIMPIP